MSFETTSEPTTIPPTTSITTTPLLSCCPLIPPNPPVINAPIIPNFTTLTIPQLVVNLITPTSLNPFTLQITITTTSTTTSTSTTTIIPTTGTIVPIECVEYCKKLGF